MNFCQTPQDDDREFLIVGGDRIEVRRTKCNSGWFVSSDGRIFRTGGRGAREMKPGLSGRKGQERYKMCLFVDGRKRPIFLSRIIYEAWHGCIPFGTVIDHIDRNPTNNSLSNLRAVPPSANMANRASKRGLRRGVRAPRHRNSKFQAILAHASVGSSRHEACASAMYRIAFFAKYGFEVPA